MIPIKRKFKPKILLQFSIIIVMKVLVFFLLLSHALCALTLKEKFQKGEAGTYVVTEQNRMTSLLHLHTIKENRILLEEISIPSHLVCHTDWKGWAKRGAHGHTAWVLYEIDLNKNQIIECYSPSRKAWISSDNMESFFLPLLSLNLLYLSEDRRIQSAPIMGADYRPWGPTQIIHGKKIESPEYDAYTATWPRDNSNYSGKHIVLYFDKTQETFPFPYWVHLYKGAFKFNIRAIDSGTGFTSSIIDIPRRMPTFIGGIKQDTHTLSLSLNIPAYYDNFTLYAIDTTERSRYTHAVPFEMNKEGGESTTLFIKKKELSSLLSTGHEYLWMLTSKNPDVVIKHPQIFILQ